MLDNKKSNESKKFINLETMSAKLLLVATVLALLSSNSPFRHYYDTFVHANIIHTWQLNFNLLDLINDGLMTIFFLVVGLEVKYEILKGSLNSFSKAALPVIGAIGGMLLPALIYVGFNFDDPYLLRGWAVPTATDIAFSLAVLSFFGSRIPFGLKAYLTSLAIFDDLAAILIIALFYTSHIQIVYLGFVLVIMCILFILNKMHIQNLFTYLIFGLMLWFSFLKSGIHPTLAGVLLAFMIPLENRNQTISPLQKLQRILHPWVALMILPLFAFANAGMTFSYLNQANLHMTVMLGAFLGLFFGKQFGIFSAAWLAVKYRIAALPDQVSWYELYAVAVLCGIGFTISLFIGALAFNTSDGYLNSIKIGVLSGSLLSGIIGYLLLFLMYRKK